MFKAAVTTSSAFDVLNDVDGGHPVVQQVVDV
jgi:hypothetical protein